MYISLDLGGTALKYGFGSPEVGLVHQGKATLHGKSRQAIYNLLTSTALMLRDMLPAGEKLEAVSLGSPGVIDCEHGVVVGHCPNLPEWRGAEPGRVLSERLGVPVFVDNDANLMAYGEAARYGFKGVVLGVTLGTGVGSGLVVGDEIFTGGDWAGMELGHVIVEPEGRLCGCGRRGCIEAYASATALVELAAPVWRECGQNSVNEMDIPTIKQVLDNIVDNKSMHMVVLHQMERLGLVLANAVAVLSPHVVVVGGGVSEIPSFPWQELEAAFHKHLLDVHRGRVKLEKATLGNTAALVGGIWRGCGKLASAAH